LGGGSDNQKKKQTEPTFLFEQTSLTRKERQKVWGGCPPVKNP